VQIFGRAVAWLGAAGFAVAAIGAGAGIALAQTPQPDFGTPPSGEIPILFNDHHVYSTPDRERENRVLAAIVKNGTILVPLRSLFEQTGATVTYDPQARTVIVTKPGADVKVTLGKPIVSINGEDRPLDVPPEIYKGSLVVPLRVIAEGMGAYVQWLPDKRLVVVRYNAAPPSPTPPPATPPPPPAPVPTPAPTAAPTAAPTVKPQAYEAFVAGDYDISPAVYNELSAGNKANSAYGVNGGFEFPITSAERGMLAIDFRTVRYPHNSALGASVCTAGSPGCNTVSGHDVVYQPGFCPSPGDPGCVTVVGFGQTQAFNGLGQAYVPAFTATESDFDVRLGFQVAAPRVYIGGSYYRKNYNYLGYPNLSGFGFGLDKLPDLDKPFSIDGNVWYYPSVSGNYTYPTSVFLGPLSGSVIKLQYSVLKYRAGATFDLGATPLYLEAGYQGEHFTGKSNAPANTSITSPFVGLGLHI
jgi:Copper amine oxidase N-terminal domain